MRRGLDELGEHWHGVSSFVSRPGFITRLIGTPARVAHSAHRQVFHLPRDWPWEPGLDELFRRALHDSLPAAS